MSLKTIGVLQPGYLPWLGFFEQLHRCDVFVIYDDVQFEKGSWRNRNRIKTPQGSNWLTVPVLSKSRGAQPIKDIEINQSVPWQTKHFKTIAQNYSKAPFYDLYIEGLRKILMQSFKFLIDIDMQLIDWLAEHLGISTPIIFSSELGISGNGVQRLIDIINHLGGDCFYEGQAGKNYIDDSEFNDAGINIIFQDYRHPVYPQLYGNFVSHLSALDLLFNCGRESRAILLNNQMEES